MTSINWNEINILAKSWVKEAGMKLRGSFKETLSIDFKMNPSDLVTNMDKQTEQFFISKIAEHFPEHRVLGEEGFGDELKDLSGIVWIIDPIDGTMNFVHMQRHFAISVGVYKDGVGMLGIIYDVVQDEIYDAIKGEGAYMNGEKLQPLKAVPVEEAILSINASWVIDNRNIEPNILPPLVRAVRGTRAFGSAAIEIANVAANRTDGYITLRLSPWDFAAGRVIVEEVGGKMTTVKGEPLKMLEVNTVFVGKPGLHEDILERFLLTKDV